MQDQIPSKTAYRVALRRAVHQLLDTPPVFEDPLAAKIIGGESGVRAQLNRAREAHPASRHLRAFIAVRSRLAEDELAAAVSRGVRQYIVLGAGLDTFAYRNPHADLRVFEIDHPATQAWKRQMLAAAKLAPPPSLTFVPVDFEMQFAGDALRDAGFNANNPAFISWLGVVPYLSEEAFAQTLKWIGKMPPGSALIFDYAADPKSVSFLERMAFNALAKRVAAAGEPFRLFRMPDALANELHGYGFKEIHDMNSAAINNRYFANRADGLRIGGKLAHIMYAQA